MTILFEPAPTGTTHFIRYASGHVVWCKVGPGENDQLVLKEWDSFNKFWVPGIHKVEHYESAGLTKIEDFPTEPASPVPESSPTGATHCYHHAGEVSWYRETADNLFVWRDGSWYASVYKKALDLANACPLGAVSIISQSQKQPVTRIAPAKVSRDQMGMWVHPDFPDFGEVLGDEYRAWIAEQQIACVFVTFEDDAPEELADQLESLADYTGLVEKWTPTAPAGDDWFLLGIWDTEDGPVALFACYLENLNQGGAA